VRFALVVRHGTGFMRLKSKEGLSVNIGTSTMEAGSRREGGSKDGMFTCVIVIPWREIQSVCIRCTYSLEKTHSHPYNITYIRYNYIHSYIYIKHKHTHTYTDRSSNPR